MATTNISIKNGAIVNYSDRYFRYLSEDGKRYEGNGWTVTIKDSHKDRPGRIICHAERVYSDGPAVCHREFKLADGTLGLAGGNICSRYAYFRSEEFQEFLRQFGITAVKKEDPNRDFFLRNALYGGGSCRTKVYTDGSIDEPYETDYGRSWEWQRDCPGTCASEVEKTQVVSGATWTIVEKKQDERDRHNSSCILYTLVKDVMSLRESLMAHPEIGSRA